MMFLRFLRGSTGPIKIMSSGRGPPVPPSREVCHLSGISHQRLPWKFRVIQALNGLQHRYCLWRLRRLLGVAFDESGFHEGTRQAAATMMEAVRLSDWLRIRSCCTERGSVDIYGLSQSSQRPVSSLMRFQSQHLRQAVPVRVVREWIDGQCCVLVDMLFVGLRNLIDFDNKQEQAEVFQRVQNVLSELQIGEFVEPKCSCLVAAEVGLTFCKKLGELEEDSEDLCGTPDRNGDDGWLVDSYCLHHFKLISFRPDAQCFRIIEFLKPV